MTKISLLPEDTAPTTDDYTVSLDNGSDTTKKVTWLNIFKMFVNNLLITPQLIAPATSIVSSATITPDLATRGIVVTALAVSATIAAPVHTGLSIQELQGFLIRITDNGSAQSLSYNAIYHTAGVTAPSVTVPGQSIYLSCAYNSVTSKVDILSVNRG